MSPNNRHTLTGAHEPSPHTMTMIAAVAVVGVGSVKAYFDDNRRSAMRSVTLVRIESALRSLGWDALIRTPLTTSTVCVPNNDTSKQGA